MSLLDRGLLWWVNETGSPEVVATYQRYFNTIANLQLLTDKENLEKNAAAFDTWLSTRDGSSRRDIPSQLWPTTGSAIFWSSLRSVAAISRTS